MAKAYKRLISLPKTSFLLLGARGTGKSTLLRKSFPKALSINLLDERLYQSYLADIGLFFDEVSTLKRGSWVFVDEVQRLPQLLNEVHRLIEEYGLKFALSGSSARKLRRSGVNLLAGRAIQSYLYPLTPQELGDDFNLNSALAIGTIPVICTSPNPQKTLEAYVQTYLKEEIQAEAIVKNLPGFARFLPIAALANGQTLSISSIARDAEVARTTVDSFFGILEDTLIGFRWPAYEAKLRIREKKHPKFYFIDPGIVRAIKGTSGSIAPEEKGHLFEGWLAQLLRTYKESKGLYDQGFYWSPAETKKTEVDFLLKRGSEFLAIECKSSKKLSPSDYAGLRAIEELRGLKRRILVYLGEKDRNHEGIEVLSLKSFLKLLEKGF